MNKFIVLLVLLISNAACAQESNNDKQLWASSILNQKAPELVVEKWISKAPETEGKFILIDFWATWCAPCREFIPTLNSFQQQYGDQLTVIGLSDEPEQIIEAFTGPKITYSEAIDTKRTLNNALKIKAIPHVILISPKGIVIWEGYPLLEGHKLTDDVLKALLSKYKP
jgi:cytochrome c biogenesis protein CcmG, thiol:disulfide interchange protein DsbE